ncbi:MAG: saccharopine dehydrogenase [Planctomycetes bacterium]|nr:saccharopine dehydrogenase [Planctomycetota bacterium]
MKIVLLGAGLVGGPMAVDLSRDEMFEVTAVDVDQGKLDKLRAKGIIKTRQADLGDAGQVTELVGGYDMVVNAVPGFMGYQTLKAIIEAGRNVVDISFFSEDPFTLDEAARAKGVVAIVDCGVAPGMSNLLVGHVEHWLDEIDSVVIYVGGLPIERIWPYEYKAGFSPIDVIEEYTRPARFIRDGKLVTKDALTDAEYIDFPGVGTLEAFNTDGLRTLMQTIKAPNMIEKTLRYPDHISKIAVLRDTGFFRRDEIDVDGVKVRPMDLTAKLLFPKWKLGEEEADLTVMRIFIKGQKDGEKLCIMYDLLDKYDPQTQTHSMARTTGYTATAMVRLLAQELFTTWGISPPEYIGRQPECVHFILQELKARGIKYEKTKTIVESS